MTNLLTTSSMIMCPHGGIVNAISSNAKVKAAGSYLLRASDTFIMPVLPIPARKCSGYKPPSSQKRSGIST
jgi:hypothetical protein